MKLIRCAAAAAIAALALAGCEQSQRTASTLPKEPAQTSTPSTTPVGSTTISDASTRDPSLPDASVALAPKQETNPHSAMTPAERDRQMPMKGQVNDYNTPDRAKEADQPRTAAKEPGGQEAKPGNQPEASTAPRS